MTLSEHTHTATGQDLEETIVVFRVYRDSGDLIGLFPGIKDNPFYCACYLETGAHTWADYEGVIGQSRPATEEEYEDMVEDLTAQGYRLCVRKKKPLTL
jgi:hypothetical protein